MLAFLDSQVDTKKNRSLKIEIYRNQGLWFDTCIPLLQLKLGVIKMMTTELNTFHHT